MYLTGVSSRSSSLPSHSFPASLPYAKHYVRRWNAKQNHIASLPSKISKGRGSVVIKAHEMHWDTRGRAFQGRRLGRATERR